MVYIFMTTNPYTHTKKAKAKEQVFYCRSSSQINSAVFNMEQTLTSLQFQDGPLHTKTHQSPLINSLLESHTL